MYRALFRNRAFLLLWFAQIAGTLGNELYNIGVMVTIFQRTGSALQTAVVMVLRMAPPFLLGPVAGVLVDRYPRRLILIAINLLRAILLLSLLLMQGNARLETAAIYLVVSGLAVADIFYRPAQMALLPLLVPRRDLVAANSLVLSTNQGAAAIGYGMGGILVLGLGLAGVITLNLLLFLISAGLLMFLRAGRDLPARDRDGRRIPLHTALVDGVRYLRGHRIARALITMEFLEHWPHGVWTAAIMLAFTQEALGKSAQEWGYQNAAYYSGHLVGALIAIALAAPLARRPGWVIIGNALLVSALTLAYAASPSVAMAIIVSFSFGPPMALRDVAQDSLLQATVDPAVLGRVYATRQMLASAAFMVAGVSFAWLADVIPVRQVYVLGAMLYAGTALYAAMQAPLRESRLDGDAQAAWQESLPGVEEVV